MVARSLKVEKYKKIVKITGKLSKLLKNVENWSKIIRNW
jgi:hypothetical protein